MANLVENYDVVIVGAGHAGCEAALASARLGLNTIVFTVSVDSIALMPCNPNIGGTSKGHLVRELDALGGEMGKNIDKTFIQSKMLNKSKGPAVHSLRAQADKQDYTREMRKTLENTENLTIRQAEVAKLLVEDGVIKGVETVSGATYYAKSVVLATGVYLKAKCIYGDVCQYTGPNGLMAANNLTASLIENGIKVRRFKTGTPARVDKRSIDFSKMEEQFGDERVVPFSFSTDPESVQKDQISCWLTYTNEKTHEIIRENINRSPLFSGMIEGTGPRYCPSIEDKVVKFADKNRHQVFIEPEGLFTNEMYLGGMSSSLPEDVQYAMYKTVPGLENVKIVRNAYAIEYDCIEYGQLLPNLEFKKIEGLFSAGQFNGSSGYEEAAAQGIIAGINAARYVQNKESIVLDRSQAYIGVLIDDLVTKESHEPYVVIASGDGIYKLDYGKVLEEHISKGADITVVCKDLAPGEDDVNRFGVIQMDADNRIVDFEEKPLVAGNNTISTGIYVIRRRQLIELLETCANEGRTDFVRDILVRYKNVKKIYGYKMDTYWRNIGTKESYYKTNMDFLNRDVRNYFFKQHPDIYSKVEDLPPAKYNGEAVVNNSLVASGCIINGTVENSVLFKKVYIGNNCVIRNSIILNDVHIGDNCVIENCIVESRDTIRANTVHQGSPDDIKVIVEKNFRYAL